MLNIVQQSKTLNPKIKRGGESAQALHQLRCCRGGFGAYFIA